MTANGELPRCERFRRWPLADTRSRSGCSPSRLEDTAARITRLNTLYLQAVENPGHPGRPSGDPEASPHINWWDYHFDEIDVMDVDDLSKNFDDIWYPSVDGVEIFDESETWFLSVSHDGRLTLLEL